MNNNNKGLRGNGLPMVLVNFLNKMLENIMGGKTLGFRMTEN